MILIIDCSRGLNLIIGNKKNILATISRPNLKKVSESLIIEVQKILNTVNKRYNNLSKIIVINGPGSFTGVRTAVTTAKILGLSLNIPVCGISLFDLLKIRHAKLNNKTKQKIFIHLNNSSFFSQDLLKSGKNSEIELINLSAELKLQLSACDVVSNSPKIRKYIKMTKDKLKKEDIFIYSDLFIKAYITLISLNEKKYIPNPIYVKTF
jgi:tRNA threonylcarbamoyl adenosine modification protein YeaZ